MKRNDKDLFDRYMAELSTSVNKIDNMIDDLTKWRDELDFKLDTYFEEN